MQFLKINFEFGFQSTVLTIYLWSVYQLRASCKEKSWYTLHINSTENLNRI